MATNDINFNINVTRDDLKNALKANLVVTKKVRQSVSDIERNFAKLAINITKKAPFRKMRINIEKANKSVRKLYLNVKTLATPLTLIGKGASKLGRVFARILPSVTPLGVALTALGAGLFFKKAIDSAVELENSLIGLRTVAGAFGEDSDKISKKAKELAADGLVPLRDVSASLKNLLATGVGADKAVQAFNALKNAAAFNRQGQLDLGEAIRGASEGLKNQLSIKVDNAGITKNLSNLQKEYAKTIGTSIGKLTDYQKNLANVTGVIREGAIFTGDYQKLMETFAGATSRAKTQTGLFVAEIGTFIVKSPVIIKAISLFSDGVEKLRGFLTENRTAVQDFIKKGLVLIPDAVLIVVGAIEGLVSLKDKVVDFFDFFNTKGFETSQLEKYQKELKAINEQIEKQSTVEVRSQKQKEQVEAYTETLKKERSTYETLVEAQTKLVENENETNTKRLETRGTFFETIKEKTKEFQRQILEINTEDETRKQEARDKDIQAEKDAKKEREKLAKQEAEKKRNLTSQYFKDVTGFATKYNDFEDTTTKERIETFKDSFNRISTLASSENKTLAAIGKAAAISTATIDGIAAVQKALASAPPPFNFALAALVGTATAANVAKIAGVKFATGGIVEGHTTTGDQVSAKLNAGEMVINKTQQSELFQIANGRNNNDNQYVELMNRIMNQPIILEINNEELARATRSASESGFRIA